MKKLPFMLVFAVIALTACQQQSSGSTTTASANASTTDASAATPAADKGELNVYNWEAYFPDALKEAFTKETGIKLNYEEYDSNEMMLAKVSQSSGYDLIFPSLDYLPVLKDKNLIQPIDVAKIPNLSNIDKDVLDTLQKVDNQNYALPYNIGSTGILYSKAAVTNPGTSLSILSDPKYKGKIVILDDTREVFSAALHTLGFSSNTKSTDELNKAVGVILKWKANALTLDSSNMPTLVSSGKAVIAFGYPENVLSELSDTDKAKFGFFLPKEKGMKYFDTVALLKDAKNVENALAFINFIYRPENLAQIADAYGYPGISEASKQYRKTTPYYTVQDLKDFELRSPVGDALNTYTKLWEDKVKIGQ